MPMVGTFVHPVNHAALVDRNSLTAYTSSTVAKHSLDNQYSIYHVKLIPTTIRHRTLNGKWTGNEQLRLNQSILIEERERESDLL